MLLAVFLGLPAGLRARPQRARHAGLRPHGFVRPRPLRAGDPRRRGVPPEPAEHAAVHGRGGRAPDGARPPPGGARRGDAARTDAVPCSCSSRPFVLAPVAVGTVWKFLFAPFFGIVPDAGRRARARHARPSLRSRTRRGAVGDHGRLPVAVRGFQHGRLPGGDAGLPREYDEYALLEGPAGSSGSDTSRGRCCGRRRSRWSLLTTIGTLRIFDMVWIMTAGGPAHATETVATDVYMTAFRSLDVGYAQAMAMILLVLIVALAVVEYRLLNRRAEAVSGVTGVPASGGPTVVLGRPRGDLALPGDLDARERGQVERRHLPRPRWDLPVAAGHRQHRRGLEPRPARRRAARTRPMSRR